jgi:hypothetical protein
MRSTAAAAEHKLQNLTVQDTLTHLLLHPTMQDANLPSC